ncbi:MAG: glucose-6-phosphate isomerase [Candidatus Nealsonbacteria bacterium CG10_big_fil_rev_8_21_14_0_10_36_24]|uniref:glucose-6-phosphate isomerase n=2 Tax=Candidatus Nealsoniibacteriota TaxID=1817911 RepID=A0A2H0YN85_9BACT|nr:MAG: glucose-6-phosphate isomerase [Candidatus Nealsonbacteria bacterium CG10_big_fil_rev_8_21_14_0_10_36_24]PIS39876.1 MAG: glucose-6-phosphate isomerase [Candidatus Nealsonbacteria bacterium CG08_land_8_20_14_0_20_36_22]
MEIRYLYDMKEVIYDRKWLRTAPNLELYYMYRGLKEKNGLRYDITIIPAKMVGKEFVKTKGHEHIGKYGEVYVVLEGEAIYLMQKREKDIIKDVYAVKAKKNDIVVILPDYGHVTINPWQKALKMANWMAKEVKSDYKPIQKMQGACYFAVAQKSESKEQSAKLKWIKNKNYKKVPKLRFEKPLKSMPKNLDFLKG